MKIDRDIVVKITNEHSGFRNHYGKVEESTGDGRWWVKLDSVAFSMMFNEDEFEVVGR